MPSPAPAAPITTLRDWAQAIAALPAEGPLPCRTVVVPRHRMAVALKRELIAQGEQAALSGTSFLTLPALAREVLAMAGELPPSGEEALRPLRLQRLFSEDLPLKHFDLAVLRKAPGWNEAFASTLCELESACLTPAKLRAAKQPRFQDLALLWERLQKEQGATLTTAALLRRAAALLTQGAQWPFRGATLAVVTGHESAAEAELLRSIPNLTLRALWALPQSERHAQRAKALFGQQLPLSPEPSAQSAPKCELELLQRYLFSDARALAEPSRPRSKGPDGSVFLEEHAGVESELAATVAWVVARVREGTPLGNIAVLVPHADPHVSLLAARLAELPFPFGQFPVFVAGGIPATSTPAGKRLHLLLRALGAFLSLESLIPLLPHLRPTFGNAPLRYDEALSLCSSLGTLGGTEGALEWHPAALRIHGALNARIALLKTAKGQEDEEAEARNLRSMERHELQLGGLLSAFEALHRLASLLVGHAPLSTLWSALDAFVLEHLSMPEEGQEITGKLKEAVDALCAGEGKHAVTGLAALGLVEETLSGLRRSQGRFGTPAVYVGTVGAASGLSFDAVRIIGLAEGSIPPSLREDVVLDSEARQLLDSTALPTREGRALSMVHSLHRVVLGARCHLTLSYPRASLDGSVHETSSLFIEAMAALARPDAATGAPASPVPTLSQIASNAFSPARVALQEARIAKPAYEGAWQERVARLQKEVPSHWATANATSPARITSLLEEERSPLDGYLGELGMSVAIRGLSAAKPISASRLRTLLVCPYQFLLSSVLGWEEPAGPQPTGEIDHLTYGTLVHRILERFGREHGKALSGTRPEAHFRAALAALAKEEFDRLLESYALLGDGVRNAQWRRLEVALAAFFEEEWQARTRRSYVDAERAFGVDEGLAVRVDGKPIYVRGFIDRLDTEDGRTLVRDYKSGRAHPRRGAEAGPTYEVDAQIALYALVVRTQAKEWKLPAKVSMAYAYPNPGEPLRAFVEDAKELEAAAAGWLTTARELLERRTFPRTPDAKSCGLCAFKPLCGASGPRRSSEFLSDPQKSELGLVELWQLKKEPS